MPRRDRSVAPSRHKRGGWHVRAVLSLGIALGLGAVGTMAFWSSTDSVDSGSVTAAQLDVTVNGNLAGAASRDGQVTEVSWAMNQILPGERRAVSFTVANNGVGNIPFDLRLNGYTNGTLGDRLRFTLYDGGTAVNSGGSLTAPTQNQYRTGVCQGGTQVGPSFVAVGGSAATSTVLDSTKLQLNVGQSHTYCAVIALDSGPSTFNNTSLWDTKATAVFVVRATQLGAP